MPQTKRIEMTDDLQLSRSVWPDGPGTSDFVSLEVGMKYTAPESIAEFLLRQGIAKEVSDGRADVQLD